MGEGDEAFPVALSGEPETTEERMTGGVSEGKHSPRLGEVGRKRCREQQGPGLRSAREPKQWRT